VRAAPKICCQEYNCTIDLYCRERGREREIERKRVLLLLVGASMIRATSVT